MAKTAIVLGATGLVGGHLVELLCQQADIQRVVTLTRQPLLFKHEKIENHVIDFAKLESYAELLKGDYLFSCLGSTLKQSGSIEQQRTVDLDYQLIAAKLAAANNVAFYLLVSSSGANATSQSAYLKMKGELEENIAHLTFKQIAIFQPSLLIGKRQQKRLAENIGALILPLLCKLPSLQKYSPIQGKQVATKMLQVSQQQQSQLQYYKLNQVFPN